MEVYWDVSISPFSSLIGQPECEKVFIWLMVQIERRRHQQNELQPLFCITLFVYAILFCNGLERTQTVQRAHCALIYCRCKVGSFVCDQFCWSFPIRVFQRGKVVRHTGYFFNFSTPPHYLGLKKLTVKYVNSLFVGRRGSKPGHKKRTALLRNENW